MLYMNPSKSTHNTHILKDPVIIRENVYMILVRTLSVCNTLRIIEQLASIFIRTQMLTCMQQKNQKNPGIL